MKPGPTEGAPSPRAMAPARAAPRGAPRAARATMAASPRARPVPLARREGGGGPGVVLHAGASLNALGLGLHHRGRRHGPASVARGRMGPGVEARAAPAASGERAGAEAAAEAAATAERNAEAAPASEAERRANERQWLRRRRLNVWRRVQRLGRRRTRDVSLEINLLIVEYECGSATAAAEYEFDRSRQR